ncbi:hypothetical protein HDV03_005107 [Kappamyces sp. JEL0829]|nr:hypothetical protein HDV03_005107 [Kappamyces sp. JEL0829]
MLLQLDTLEKNVLVIGGTFEASEIIGSLLQNGAIVTLVSKKDDLCKEIAGQVAAGEFAWFNRLPQARDVDGKTLVVNLSQNALVAHACKQKSVLSIDSFSALQVAPRVHVSASAGGENAHLLNASLNQFLSTIIPSFVETAAQTFDALGQLLAAESHDDVARHSFLRHIADKWPLQTIAHLGPEHLAHLVAEFKRDNLAPSVPASVPSFSLPEKSTMQRSFSQSTANELEEHDETHLTKPLSPPISVESTDLDFIKLAASTSELSLDGAVALEIVDAAEAVSKVAYQFSDMAFVYPTLHDEFSVGKSLEVSAKAGQHNLKGSVPKVVNMLTQSGSGNSILGALRGGSATNVVLSSAALGHLVPSMFGFQRDGFYPVFHVAAQTIDDDLVVHHGHGDVYKAAHTGFTILASGSLAEAQDLALISHLLARNTKTPVLHFFDGALLASQKAALHVLDSHQIQQAVQATQGLGGEPLKAFEAISKRLSKVLSSTYKPIEYSGAQNPSVVFVAIGSTAHLLQQSVHELAATGKPVGVLNIRVYRPWSATYFLSVVPRSTRKIIVLDDVHGSAATLSPLVLDLEASLYGKTHAPSVTGAKFAAGLENIHPIAIHSFIESYLSGRDVSVVEYQAPVGLPKTDGVVEAVFWDNKTERTASSVAHIQADLEHIGSSYHQTYIQHLSTAAVPGQVTHFRSSNFSFHKEHLVDQASLVMCNSLFTAQSYDFVATIRKGGKLFVNTALSHEELVEALPPAVKHSLVARQVEVFTLDANLVASNYTIFYGVASEYLSEILAAVYYHLAHPRQAPQALSAQLSRISQTRQCPNVIQSLKEAILFAIKNLKQLHSVPAPHGPLDALPAFARGTVPSKAVLSADEPSSDIVMRSAHKYQAMLPVIFPSSYNLSHKYRPDLENVYTVKITENIRLTPDAYERNVFHMELDITGTGIQYDIGTALGIYAKNDAARVAEFLARHGYDPKQVVFIDRPDAEGGNKSEIRSLDQLFTQSLDIFGKPGKKFYQFLAEKATDDAEKERIAELLKTNESFDEYVEAYTPTYADLLDQFASVKLSPEQLVRAIPAIKPRLYSISSSQRAHPNSIHLLIVVVDWVAKDGVQRYGQATSYLVNSKIGDLVTVTLKPSVMKLPPSLESPVIMSGLGTGMAPFRAFIQERMYWKKRGKKVGPMSLYFGSRNRANEYLYGEELEAYHAEGILTNLRLAFSRDQKEKIYIQNRIEQDVDELHKLIVEHGGSFYLCGPTWPVPDVTNALLKSFQKSKNAAEAKEFLEELKEHEKFVLEVY